MTKTMEKLISRYINPEKSYINGYSEYEGKYFLCDGFTAMWLNEIPAGVKKADEPLSEEQIRKILHNDYPLDGFDMRILPNQHAVNIDDLRHTIKANGGRRAIHYCKIGSHTFDAVRLLDLIDIIVHPDKYQHECYVYFDSSSPFTPLWVWGLSERPSVLHKGHDYMQVGAMMPCKL